MKNISLTLALLPLVFPTVGPARAIEPDAETMVHAMLDGTGAEVVDCPVVNVPYAREHLCVKHPSTLHSFRQEWDDYLPEVIDVRSRDSWSDWTMDWGTCCYRDHRVAGGGLRVTLDFHANLVSIVHGASGSISSDGTNAIPRAGSAGISEPVILEREKPVYPKEAKKQKIAGKVALEVVVQREGTVGDLGLIWACPQGYGLEEAAAETVRQWRFEPAMRDGEPVDASTVVFVEFGFKARSKHKYDKPPPGPPPVMGAPRIRPQSRTR
jgi:TonB family protein